MNSHYAQLRKVSDKYVLQKFTKEFERVLTFVYMPSEIEGSAEGETHSKQAQSAPLNYLRFKEFLIEMCFMTEQQATTDTLENTLAF